MSLFDASFHNGTGFHLKTLFHFFSQSWIYIHYFIGSIMDIYDQDNAARRKFLISRLQIRSLRQQTYINTKIAKMAHDVKAYHTARSGLSWSKSTMQETRREMRPWIKTILSIDERIRKSKRKLKFPCEDFDRDEIAASNESIIGRIGRNITYLAVDKNNVGIFLRWPSCPSIRCECACGEEGSKWYSCLPFNFGPYQRRNGPTAYGQIRGERNPQFRNRGATYLGTGCEDSRPHKQTVKVSGFIPALDLLIIKSTFSIPHNRIRRSIQ